MDLYHCINLIAFKCNIDTTIAWIHNLQVKANIDNGKTNSYNLFINISLRLTCKNKGERLQING